MANTNGENIKTKIYLGGPQLKRLAVTIQYKNHPETVVTGYALSHEILAHQVSFFAAQKFPVDEELIVFFTLNGEKRSLNVQMKSMHEQISSGRVMNALPSAENPFPARKFYRCYTAVVESGAAVKSTTEENTGAPEVPAETVAETTAEAPTDNVVEMSSAKPKVDPFAADEIESVPIPDVA